jgi:hypothetical protein
MTSHKVSLANSHNLQQAAVTGGIRFIDWVQSGLSNTIEGPDDGEFLDDKLGVASRSKVEMVEVFELQARVFPGSFGGSGVAVELHLAGKSAPVGITGRAQGELVYFHEPRVVFLGAVVFFVNASGILPHCSHLTRMIHGPSYFGRKVPWIPCVEVKSRMALLNELRHCAQS